jgi:hypothetical protein
VVEAAAASANAGFAKISAKIRAKIRDRLN